MEEEEAAGGGGQMRLAHALLLPLSPFFLSLNFLSHLSISLRDGGSGLSRCDGRRGRGD